MSERVPGVDRSKNFKTSQKLFREISLFYVLTTNGVGGRQRKGKNTRECKQNTFIRQGWPAVYNLGFRFTGKHSTELLPVKLFKAHRVLVKMEQQNTRVLMDLGASQVALVVKKTPANSGEAKDAGLILGSGRSPGGGNGTPLRYSCLKYPMDRGVWLATVHGASKSRSRLSVWAQWTPRIV